MTSWNFTTSIVVFYSQVTNGKLFYGLRNFVYSTTWAIKEVIKIHWYFKVFRFWAPLNSFDQAFSPTNNMPFACKHIKKLPCFNFLWSKVYIVHSTLCHRIVLKTEIGCDFFFFKFLQATKVFYGGNKTFFRSKQV